MGFCRALPIPDGLPNPYMAGCNNHVYEPKNVVNSIRGAVDVTPNTTVHLVRPIVWKSYEIRKPTAKAVSSCKTHPIVTTKKWIKSCYGHGTLIQTFNHTNSSRSLGLVYGCKVEMFSKNLSQKEKYRNRNRHRLKSEELVYYASFVPLLSLSFCCFVPICFSTLYSFLTVHWILR